MPDRWVLQWYHPLKGWQQVAAGRSRFRAALVLLVCTLARPEAAHTLVWHRTPGEVRDA